jgi:hypothetical protein
MFVLREEFSLEFLSHSLRQNSYLIVPIQHKLRLFRLSTDRLSIESGRGSDMSTVCIIRLFEVPDVGWRALKPVWKTRYRKPVLTNIWIGLTFIAWRRD